MKLELREEIDVSPSVRSELETLVRSQKTLEDVVRWGLALDPPRLVSSVVVQDEFSHDVVIAHPSGVFLAYDTT